MIERAPPDQKTKAVKTETHAIIAHILQERHGPASSLSGNWKTSISKRRIMRYWRAKKEGRISHVMHLLLVCAFLGHSLRVAQMLNDRLKKRE